MRILLPRKRQHPKDRVCLTVSAGVVTVAATAPSQHSDTLMSGKPVLACSPSATPPPKRPPHSLPFVRELLSLLVKEGASCHLRCWLSSKV